MADEKDPHLIAGATGAAACLGSDFVTVNYPIALGAGILVAVIVVFSKG